MVRASPAGPWAPGPTLVQYKEYQRSAESHGRQITSTPSTASTTSQQPLFVSLVNPTNPTGDYMFVRQMKQWIETNVPRGATITVDESMQPWVGPNWRSDSLISQTDWIQQQWQSRSVAVYVIHSWTKIWSCTGIRLGSIICPTQEHANQLHAIQVPWSVNTPALAFLDAVVRDQSYLNETWQVTPTWNRQTRDALHDLMNSLELDWELHGERFLSWIWIDMKDEALAERAVQLAREKGGMNHLSTSIIIF